VILKAARQHWVLQEGEQGVMRQGELLPDGPFSRAMVSDKLGQYEILAPAARAAWLNLSNLI
jgi:hypothetical protein